MRFQLVKPDKIENWDLKNVLDLKRDSYLKNERAISENDFKKMLREIEIPVNDLKWEMSPLKANQFVKVWLGVVQPKTKEYLLKTDPHSPINLRVNNQVKLSKKFEETFSCRQGDVMTIPDEDRITLW